MKVLAETRAFEQAVDMEGIRLAWKRAHPFKPWVPMSPTEYRLALRLLDERRSEEESP